MQCFCHNVFVLFSQSSQIAMPKPKSCTFSTSAINVIASVQYQTILRQPNFQFSNLCPLARRVSAERDAPTRSIFKTHGLSAAQDIDGVVLRDGVHSRTLNRSHLLVLHFTAGSYPITELCLKVILTLLTYNYTVQ